MSHRRKAKTCLCVIIIGLTLNCSISRTAAAQTPDATTRPALSANQGAKVEEPAFQDRPIGSGTPPSEVDDSKPFDFSFRNGAMLLAMGVVLLLIVIAAMVIRKAFPGMRMFSSLGGIQILGRTFVAPKQALAVIKVDRQLVLIGLTEHTISNLLTVSDPEDVARLLTQIEQGHKTSITGNFGRLFRSERQNFNDDDQTQLSPGVETVQFANDNADEGVSDLKSELKSLINKVNRLKGNRP